MDTKASLDAKLDSLFNIGGGLGSLSKPQTRERSSRGLNSSSKKSSSKRHVHRSKEQKAMDDKLSNVGLNKNEMASLFSLKDLNPSTATKPRGPTELKRKESKKNWNCPMCTYSNSYLLNTCEMCRSKRPIKKKKHHVHSSTSSRRQKTSGLGQMSLFGITDDQGIQRQATSFKISPKAKKKHSKKKKRKKSAFSLLGL